MLTLDCPIAEGKPGRELGWARCGSVVGTADQESLYKELTMIMLTGNYMHITKLMLIELRSVAKAQRGRIRSYCVVSRMKQLMIDVVTDVCVYPRSSQQTRTYNPDVHPPPRSARSSCFRLYLCLHVSRNSSVCKYAKNLYMPCELTLFKYANLGC